MVDISPQKQHYIVNETDTVTNITCTSDCKPSCIFTWTGPNLPAKPSGSALSMLNIPNIARNQSGTYQCHALNIVGNKTSFHINITVNCKYILLPNMVNFVISFQPFLQHFIANNSRL